MRSAKRSPLTFPPFFGPSWLEGRNGGSVRACSCSDVILACTKPGEPSCRPIRSSSLAKSAGKPTSSAPVPFAGEDFSSLCSASACVVLRAHLIFPLPLPTARLSTASTNLAHSGARLPLALGRHLRPPRSPCAACARPLVAHHSPLVTPRLASSSHSCTSVARPTFWDALLSHEPHPLHFTTRPTGWIPAQLGPTSPLRRGEPRGMYHHRWQVSHPAAGLLPLSSARAELTFSPRDSSNTGRCVGNDFGGRHLRLWWATSQQQGDD